MANVTAQAPAPKDAVETVTGQAEGGLPDAPCSALLFDLGGRTFVATETVAIEVARIMAICLAPAYVLLTNDRCVQLDEIDAAAVMTALRGQQ